MTAWSCASVIGICICGDERACVVGWNPGVQSSRMQVRLVPPGMLSGCLVLTLDGSDGSPWSWSTDEDTEGIWHSNPDLLQPVLLSACMIRATLSTFYVPSLRSLATAAIRPSNRKEVTRNDEGGGGTGGTRLEKTLRRIYCISVHTKELRLYQRLSSKPLTTMRSEPHFTSEPPGAN